MAAVIVQISLWLDIIIFKLVICRLQLCILSSPENLSANTNSTIFSTDLIAPPLEHIISFGATGSWNLCVVPNSDGIFGMKYEQNQMMMPEIGKPTRRYRCEKCGKMYTWKQGLLDHVRFVCGKDPQFHCNVCSYKTHRKGNLTRHMILLHKMDPYKKQ